MRVLLLSRYAVLGASSRVRYLQYLSYFRAQGVEVAVEPLFSDDYVRALYEGGRRWPNVFSGYWRRLLALFHARRFDVLIIEKELFPFLPAAAERFLRASGVPYLVDYDDALFHRYDQHGNPLVRGLLGRKVDVVMRQAAVVVAGNPYLAERAKRPARRMSRSSPRWSTPSTTRWPASGQKARRWWAGSARPRPAVTFCR